MSKFPTGLLLCTIITREDGEHDVVINFDVTHFSAGCPARIRWDENDHPAEPNEYEFKVTSIHVEPNSDSEPLTDAEKEILTKWFNNHYSEAYDAADVAMSEW